MTDAQQLQEAKRLIQTLMTSLPAAAEAIAAFETSGVDAKSLGLSEPVDITASNLQAALMAYEEWAEWQGAWASR